jgi:hypothetical protein
MTTPITERAVGQNADLAQVYRLDGASEQRSRKSYHALKVE